MTDICSGRAWLLRGDSWWGWPQFRELVSPILHPPAHNGRWTHVQWVYTCTVSTHRPGQTSRARVFTTLSVVPGQWSGKHASSALNRYHKLQTSDNIKWVWDECVNSDTINKVQVGQVLILFKMFSQIYLISTSLVLAKLVSSVEGNIHKLNFISFHITLSVLFSSKKVSPNHFYFDWQ